MLRALIPSALKERYRRLRRVIEHASNRRRTAEEVFTAIYARNQWGGRAGELCSGSGSQTGSITDPYVAEVTRLADSEGFRGTTFVDLGCGDFAVGRRLLPLCSSYVGVDVVRPLVERNRQLYGGATTTFLHLDITTAELPHGDVCFVRQVLQHLSNAQIRAVLAKLARYRWVLLTEHYPTDNPRIVPNKDKVHGGDVRVLDNSGVYLCEPPFDLPARFVSPVLTVRGSDLGRGNDAGVIRTLLYRPQGRAR
jgi:SAM-dependent methyltransferase